MIIALVQVHQFRVPQPKTISKHISKFLGPRSYWALVKFFNVHVHEQCVSIFTGIRSRMNSFPSRKKYDPVTTKPARNCHDSVTLKARKISWPRPNHSESPQNSLQYQSCENHTKVIYCFPLCRRTWTLCLVYTESITNLSSNASRVQNVSLQHSTNRAQRSSTKTRWPRARKTERLNLRNFWLGIAIRC